LPWRDHAAHGHSLENRAWLAQKLLDLLGRGALLDSLDHADRHFAGGEAGAQPFLGLPPSTCSLA